MRIIAAVLVLLLGSSPLAAQEDESSAMTGLVPFVGEDQSSRQADAIMIIGVGTSITAWGAFAVVVAAASTAATLAGAAGLGLLALATGGNTGTIYLFAAMGMGAASLLYLIGPSVALAVGTAVLLVGRWRWREATRAAQPWVSARPAASAPRKAPPSTKEESSDERPRTAEVPTSEADRVKAVLSAITGAGYGVGAVTLPMISTTWRDDGEGHVLRMRVLIQGDSVEVAGECRAAGQRACEDSAVADEAAQELKMAIEKKMAE